MSSRAADRPAGVAPVARSGRGVRIGIVDSGVYARHPHVGGVAGGVGIDQQGRLSSDCLDRLGHGTAVTAAIREKAPEAELYAVRIFDRSLATNIAALVAAIRWCSDAGMHLVNLSLGTSTPRHEAAMREVVASAASAGVLIVAAREDDGTRWLPGSLAGVLPVRADVTCPRETFRMDRDPETAVFRTSPHPRPIPGVPPEQNLQGVSFAVANLTGLLAAALGPTLSRMDAGDARDGDRSTAGITVPGAVRALQALQTAP